MRNILIVILAFGILMSAGCTTRRAFTSSVSVGEITEMALFTPLSDIWYIEKGNDSERSDSLSRVSSDITTKVLETIPLRPEITKYISIEDEDELIAFKGELDYLYGQLENAKRNQAVNLLPVIRSMLDANGKRFGMIVLTSGFSRRKGNYGGQVAKSFAVGLLTLGMYVPVPIKSHSNVYVFIVDAESNQVVFYRKSVEQEGEPLDEIQVEKQLNNILKDYYI